MKIITYFYSQEYDTLMETRSPLNDGYRFVRTEMDYDTFTLVYAKDES